MPDAAPVAAKVPHYRLTIRRTRADDCKAFLLDGVLIELEIDAYRQKLQAAMAGTVHLRLSGPRGGTSAAGRRRGPR